MINEGGNLEDRSADGQIMKIHITSLVIMIFALTEFENECHTFGCFVHVGYRWIALGVNSKC